MCCLRSHMTFRYTLRYTLCTYYVFRLGSGAGLGPHTYSSDEALAGLVSGHPQPIPSADGANVTRLLALPMHPPTPSTQHARTRTHPKLLRGTPNHMYEDTHDTHIHDVTQSHEHETNKDSPYSNPPVRYSYIQPPGGNAEHVTHNVTHLHLDDGDYDRLPRVDDYGTYDNDPLCSQDV